MKRRGSKRVPEPSWREQFTGGFRPTLRPGTVTAATPTGVICRNPETSRACHLEPPVSALLPWLDGSASIAELAHDLETASAPDSRGMWTEYLVQLFRGLGEAGFLEVEPPPGVTWTAKFPILESESCMGKTIGLDNPCTRLITVDTGMELIRIGVNDPRLGEVVDAATVGAHPTHWRDRNGRETFFANLTPTDGPKGYQRIFDHWGWCFFRTRSKDEAVAVLGRLLTERRAMATGTWLEVGAVIKDGQALLLTGSTERRAMRNSSELRRRGVTFLPSRYVHLRSPDATSPTTIDQIASAFVFGPPTSVDAEASFAVAGILVDETPRGTQSIQGPSDRTTSLRIELAERLKKVSDESLRSVVEITHRTPLISCDAATQGTDLVSFIIDSLGG